ncbi:MAG: hypothetical protein MUO89_02725 [Dehalococcoidia bacterium]|nr:hypothetical protein [Dehalococcoidia bacterium]
MSAIDSLFFTKHSWAGLLKGSEGMEKLNVIFFYELASHLSPLAAMTPTQTNRFDILIHANQLKPYLQNLFPSQMLLNVCKNAAEQLVSEIDSSVTWFTNATSDEKTKADSSIDQMFTQLVSQAKAFEVVLSAELNTLDTFIITQKGIYVTKDLIRQAEKILPESALIKLTPEVQIEVRESGKCLAFDVPTASGFHILRATEAVLYQYYLAVCKPRPKKKLDNWGAYIAALRPVQDPEVAKVVAILQQIKDSDRNLIMHPEVVLTPDEAFTLFETAKSVLMAMAKKLPKPKGQKEKKEVTQK